MVENNDPPVGFRADAIPVTIPAFPVEAIRRHCRACLRLSALFVLLLPLTLAADGAVREQVDRALAEPDCDTLRSLAHTLEEAARTDDGARIQRGRLVDAMLGLSDCGRTRITVLRARTLDGVPLFEGEPPLDREREEQP